MLTSPLTQLLTPQRCTAPIIDHHVQYETQQSTFNLKDTLGYQHAPEVTLLSTTEGCELLPVTVLSPGDEVGPVPLCFQAAGPADGSLEMIWIPSGLTGVQPAVVLDIPQ